MFQYFIFQFYCLIHRTNSAQINKIKKINFNIFQIKYFSNQLNNLNIVKHLQVYPASASNLENSTDKNTAKVSNLTNKSVTQSTDSMLLKKQYNSLVIYIKATFNNILLTLTSEQGQVLTWASAGSCGFKGARKGTPFAAKKVVEMFVKKSTDYFYKCNQIKIYVRGVGPGRENALRGLEKIGYISPTAKQDKNIISKRLPLFKKQLSNKIILIREITKIPHNGCRPPKKRRL